MAHPTKQSAEEQIWKSAKPIIPPSPLSLQAGIENLELHEETKEESEEDDDDDEESGRLRFKTERKEGTIIRLSDVTRERRNIPETLGKTLEGRTNCTFLCQLFFPI